MGAADLEHNVKSLVKSSIGAADLEHNVKSLANVTPSVRGNDLPTDAWLALLVELKQIGGSSSASDHELEIDRLQPVKPFGNMSATHEMCIAVLQRVSDRLTI